MQKATDNFFLLLYSGSVLGWLAGTFVRLRGAIDLYTFFVFPEELLIDLDDLVDELWVWQVEHKPRRYPTGLSGCVLHLYMQTSICKMTWKEKSSELNCWKKRSGISCGPNFWRLEVPEPATVQNLEQQTNPDRQKPTQAGGKICIFVKRPFICSSCDLYGSLIRQANTAAASRQRFTDSDSAAGVLTFKYI